MLESIVSVLPSDWLSTSSTTNMTGSTSLSRSSRDWFPVSFSLQENRGTFRLKPYRANWLIGPELIPVSVA